MYLNYFSLNTAPFGITPDTSLFFDGAERGNVLDAMLYALNSGEGIIKIVGEVGSGKTMLSRMLSKKVSDDVVLVFLLNPSIKAEQVLYAIAYDLGIDVNSNTPSVQALHLLQEKLLELYQQGKKVVLVIDEAQQMPLETLEEIRLLSNLETETEKLLQIILFGQPELDQHLDTANIRQLRERIAYSFYLTPLSWQTAEQYLNFRLAKAGHQGRAIFKPSAIKQLTKFSDGTLRRLNMLADKSLLAAYLDKKPVVESKHVRTALRDNTKGQKSRSVTSIVSVIVAACCLAVVAIYYVLNENQVSTPQVNSQPQLDETPSQIVAKPEKIAPKPALESKPSSALLNARLDAFQSWRNQNSKGYTIRLLSATGSGSKTVERFLKTINKAGDINKSYVTTLATENNDYVVYYDNFNGYSEALNALAKLPEPLKKFTPYISAIPQ